MILMGAKWGAAGVGHLDALQQGWSGLSNACDYVRVVVRRPSYLRRDVWGRRC